MLNETLRIEIERYLESNFIPENFAYENSMDSACADVPELSVPGVLPKAASAAAPAPKARRRRKFRTNSAFLSEKCSSEEVSDHSVSGAFFSFDASAGMMPELQEADDSVARPDAMLIKDEAAAYSKPKAPRRLEDVVEELEETFSERLFRLIREKDLDETEVYKKAFLDRRHFSKIRNDRNYAANKRTVLALSAAMQLSLDETRDLLNSAGFAFSRSSKFDMIMQYFFENQIYDLFVINDVLYEYGQPVFE